MGLINFAKGSPTQNYWMRARVVAQGFTIFAMLGGALVAGRGRKTKNAVSTIDLKTNST